MSASRFNPAPDPGLKAVEAALGSLSPSSTRIDRDRVMFEAGRLSVLKASRPNRWPVLAAGLAALAVGEAAWLAARPGPTVVERVVVREPATPETAGARDVAPVPSAVPPLALVRVESDYVRLRTRLLRDGIDTLPEPPTFPAQAYGRAAARPAPVAAALLRSEIDALLNPGDPS